jgi:hypothetical protein
MIEKLQKTAHIEHVLQSSQFFKSHEKTAMTVRMVQKDKRGHGGLSLIRQP